MIVALTSQVAVIQQMFNRFAAVTTGAAISGAAALLVSDSGHGKFTQVLSKYAGICAIAVAGIAKLCRYYYKPLDVLQGSDKFDMETRMIISYMDGVWRKGGHMIMNASDQAASLGTSVLMELVMHMA